MSAKTRTTKKARIKGTALLPPIRHQARGVHRRSKWQGEAKLNTPLHGPWGKASLRAPEHRGVWLTQSRASGGAPAGHSGADRCRVNRARPWRGRSPDAGGEPAARTAASD